MFSITATYYPSNQKQINPTVIAAYPVRQLSLFDVQYHTTSG